MSLTQTEKEDKDIALIIKHLPIDKGLKILDLGCGDCSNLYNIFNTFPGIITNMTGIDHGKDEDGEEIVLNNDFYDNYNSFFYGSTIPEGIGEFIPMDVELFINKSNEKYDLIIMANFIHLFPWEYSKKLLNKTLQMLSSTGIIYLKVANENHKFNFREDRFPFDLDSLYKIKSISNIVEYTNNKIHYNIILKPKL